MTAVVTLIFGLIGKHAFDFYQKIRAGAYIEDDQHLHHSCSFRRKSKYIQSQAMFLPKDFDLGSDKISATGKISAI